MTFAPDSLEAYLLFLAIIIGTLILWHVLGAAP
jgi:hypothetical protein